MGSKLTKAVLKTAEGFTKQNVNSACTWLLYQPKISRATCNKLKKY